MTIHSKTISSFNVSFKLHLKKDIMDFPKKHIGAMLKAARESRKLTQGDLAKKIQKQRSYISRIEKNGSNVNLKTLIKIVEEGLEGQVKITFEMK